MSNASSLCGVPLDLVDGRGQVLILGDDEEELDFVGRLINFELLRYCCCYCCCCLVFGFVLPSFVVGLILVCDLLYDGLVVGLVIVGIVDLMIDYHCCCCCCCYCY